MAIGSPCTILNRKFFRRIDELREFNVQPALADLNRIADARPYQMPHHEFGPDTPHVRNARRPHLPEDHAARFNSLQLLNDSFYISNVTAGDVSSGKFTVTARFVDFKTGRTVLHPLTIRIPPRSRPHTVLFRDIFESYCDATEQVPSYPNGKDHENGRISHDMKVYCRRSELKIFDPLSSFKGNI